MRQTDRQTDRQTRNSSVEVLKVIAIFLIVTSHVTQTLVNTTGPIKSIAIPITTATADIQTIILMLFQQTGALGNTIFFVCSAWFLLDSNKFARKKAFSLLTTVWSVSVLIFCLYLIVGNHNITTKEMIKQVFPTTFANNWYMTCYIIFLFIYPWLNKLISITNQRQLLRIVLFSSTLWIVICYFKGGLFFTSSLTIWISIYFLIAYLKLYCKNIVTNTKVGVWLIVVGFIGYISQVVVTNYVGLYFISFFSEKVMRWNSNNCPFYIMIALGSLIIALKSNFKSKFINYISSLSMLVYLFHENYLFRIYTRPIIWKYLYKTFTFNNVVLLDLAYSLILFVVAVIISLTYKEIIQKFVSKVSDRLYLFVSNIYSKIERTVLKLK